MSVFSSTQVPLAYTSTFNVGFQNYQTSPASTILFQLRANQQILYGSSQIIVPLLLFTQENENAYYQGMTLPNATNLWIDFFDSEQNYLGSTDLMQGPLSQLSSTGQLAFKSFDMAIQKIKQNAVTGFYSQQQFEGDLKRILELLELLRLGYVTDAFSVLVTSDISQIISYLNLVVGDLSRYDQSNFEDYRKLLLNQKRVILILYNMMTVSSSYTSALTSYINIFTQATANFNDLCFNSGEDSQFLASTVLWMQQQLKVQLDNVKLQNKTAYFNKIYNVSTTVQ